MINDPETILRVQRDPTSNPIKRYDQEWHGPWRANVAASNCYRGSKENVGWHADQLTYLGPYPTIASLSLGTTRQFRLRPVDNVVQPDLMPSRTYSISLPHNSLLVMHAGCQERYKHCVPPQPSIDVFKNPSDPSDTYIQRINITFRFYRPDFRPSRSIPLLPSSTQPLPATSESTTQANNVVCTPRCHCGIPAILRADQKGKVAGSRHLLHQPRPSSSSPSNDLYPPSNPKFQFFWHCQAGQQNLGQSCRFFKLLDLEKENRGPCLGDLHRSKS